MKENQELTAMVRGAMERGTRAAEEIHQEVAGLPITLLEGLGLAGDTTKEIRQLQSRSITAVYDVVRRVQTEVTGFADELFESEPPKAS